MALQFPAILMHCTLAIYKEGGLHKSSATSRFRQAFDIARSRLTEYGFLVAGSDKGEPGDIHLTSKGRLRESVHRKEGALVRQKQAEFMRMWALIEMQYEEDVPGRSEDVDRKDRRQLQPMVKHVTKDRR